MPFTPRCPPPQMKHWRGKRAATDEQGSSTNWHATQCRGNSRTREPYLAPMSEEDCSAISGADRSASLMRNQRACHRSGKSRQTTLVVAAPPCCEAAGPRCRRRPWNHHPCSARPTPRTCLASNWVGPGGGGGAPGGGCRMRADSQGKPRASSTPLAFTLASTS